MQVHRTLRSLTAFAALVLVASSAHATYYTFTGKFVSNRGTFITIPVVGNTPCPSLTIMSGPGLPAAMSMVPAPTTPAARTMTVPANQYQCVKAQGLVNATMAGVGAGFVLPPKVLSKPFIGYVPAVQITKG